MRLVIRFKHTINEFHSSPFVIAASTRGESGKEQHHPQIMDASLEFCDKPADNNNSSSNSPEMEARPRKKSSLRVPGDNDDEKVMIDQQLMSRRRSTCNGRFLTMHKRRRKKLTTRSLLQDVAILDDVLHGQVQCILNQVHNWRFNAFTLETVTGGEWEISLKRKLRKRPIKWVSNSVKSRKEPLVPGKKEFIQN